MSWTTTWRSVSGTSDYRAEWRFRVSPDVAHWFVSQGINPATMPLVIHRQESTSSTSRELVELLSKPGAPDAETAGKLREGDDTMQVSLLTT